MNTNYAYDAIAALDLEPIKIKLMHKSGQGWSQGRADAIATEYRRFLYLQHVYRGEMSSPTADVDTFWHYHILDTMKYAADCERAFGYFMHHYPYVGMLDGEDGDDVLASERTQTLYEATFGEAYIRAEVYGADGNGLDVDVAPTGAASARCMQQCGVAGAQREPESASASARCAQMCGVGKPSPQSRDAARSAMSQVH